VPVEQLLPQVSKTKNRNSGGLLLRGGIYESPAHRVFLGEKAGSGVAGHEYWHGIQYLLSNYPKPNNPYEEKAIVKQNNAIRNKFREPAADVGTLKRPFRLDRKDAIISGLSTAAAFFVNPLFLGAATIRPALSFLRKRRVNTFFKKHGIDGMLLVYVFPPIQGDALFLGRYEKKLIQDGFLQEAGGLTKKGIEAIKSRVSKEELLRKINPKKVK
jgi:hypothetical protein